LVALDRLVQRLASGSVKDALENALNQTFIGEFLGAAGMKYDVIDIALGYKMVPVDFNNTCLPFV
jgi:hypothetical protein